VAVKITTLPLLHLNSLLQLLITIRIGKDNSNTNFSNNKSPDI